MSNIFLKIRKGLTPILYSQLTVVKTADNMSPNYGSNVTFTLTATNNGPDNDTNVVVTDILGDGFTFVSADPSADYNSTTGKWTVGNLSTGTTVDIEIVATVNSGETYANTATGVGNNTDTGSTNTSTITLTPTDGPTFTGETFDGGAHTFVAPTSTTYRIESTGGGAIGGDGKRVSGINRYGGGGGAGSHTIYTVDLIKDHTYYIWVSVERDDDSAYEPDVVFSQTQYYSQGALLANIGEVGENFNSTIALGGDGGTIPSTPTDFTFISGSAGGDGEDGTNVGGYGGTNPNGFGSGGRGVLAFADRGVVNNGKEGSMTITYNP